MLGSMLEQDLLLLFKGTCTGFFYTFISISGMILVAHYIIGKNFRLGLTAALGIVAVQVLWSAIALLIMMGLIKSANINHPGFALNWFGDPLHYGNQNLSRKRKVRPTRYPF